MDTNNLAGFVNPSSWYQFMSPYCENDTNYAFSYTFKLTNCLVMYFWHSRSYTNYTISTNSAELHCKN